MHLKDLKNWIEIKTNDSWSVFMIMREFVDGYEKMSKIGPCVSIFRSARTKKGDKFYKVATTIVKDIVDMGLGIMTGVGQGIKLVANRGAKESLDSSLGLNIELPFEQDHNNFIEDDRLGEFDYFFVRKVTFVKYSQVFIVMQGRFGTLDQLFEAITLKQTKKYQKFPISLVSCKFWENCYTWIKSTLVEYFNNISPVGLDLISIVDNSSEVIEILSNFYKQKSFSTNL